MTKGRDQDRPFGKDAVCRALIGAATTLIARQGVAGVTTRQIADAARVNQGLITRYFGSKQALMRQVAQEVATQMFEEVLHSSLGLEDLLVAGVPGQEETLRALIQILFDPELAGEGLVLTELQGRFSRWLADQKGMGADGDRGRAARVFLVASVVLGGQLVASSTRTGLGLDDPGYLQLKRDAYGLFLKALGPGPGLTGTGTT